MATLCLSCVKASSLKNLLVASGSVGDCNVCGAKKQPQLDCNDKAFKSKFRALIRYFYSETDYNTHLGGEGIEALFFKENEITDYRDDFDVDTYEEAILEITDPAYEDHAKGISLFAGYGQDGIQNRHLIALSRDSDERLRELKISAFRKNHFLLEDNVRALLEPLAPRIEAVLGVGSTLFRARVGFTARAFALTGWFEERHYRPFEGGKLGAPPPPVASAGRMNRAGVSFLYVATTADTAIAEIRPHPGHFCSVGAFRSTKKLRVANLGALEVTDFAASDKELGDYLLLKTVDDAFSIPVIPEEKTEYHFPQLLADTFRHLHFDGVCYRSSVGSGKNYVFFDPDSFCYEADSSIVVKIESLKYVSTSMVEMGNDGDYLTRPDGSFV